MNYLAKFFGFIDQDVKEENETKTIPVMLRIIAVGMTCYYLLFFVIVSEYKPLVPMGMAVACIVMYLVSFFMTYRGKAQAAVIWTHLFLLLWTIVFVLYFGWEGGAQQFLAALLVLGFVSSVSDYRLKVIYAGLLIVLRLGLFFYSRTHIPLCDLQGTFDVAFQGMNSFAFFSIIVIVVVNFTRNSNTMERKLKSYNEKLEKLASVDPLTGLKNRRCMMQFLEKHLESSLGKEDGRTTIVIGDIDFFKRFNDQYGHACGDEVLCQLAAAFMDFMEDKGEVARWGGEEFLLVFTDADINQTLIHMDKLQHKIRLMEVHYGGEALRVTMTFGMAQIRDGQTIDSTISMADKMLYQGKQAGRNRIVHALGRSVS